jgi:mannosyltransferase
MKAPRDWHRERVRLALLALVVLAAGLRLFRLGAPSFWYDEAFSVLLAGEDWGTFSSFLVRQEAVKMSLYLVLLRLWLPLGESEAVVRLLSAIPAVATVPVLYSLGARLFDRHVGLLAALLLTVNAFHIQYAQEARGYSLVVFLVVLSGFFLVRSLERPSAGNGAGYVLSSVLALYAHLFAGLVLLGQWLALGLLRPRGVRWRVLLGSGATILLLSCPLVFRLFTGPDRVQWLDRPSILAPYFTFNALAGRGGGRGELLGLLYALCALPALLRGFAVWRRSHDSLRAWAYGLLVAWLAVPILVAFAVSLLIEPVFMSRYLIVSLPSLVLLAAVGIRQLRPRWLSTGALALLLGLAAQETLLYFRDHRKEEWREVVGSVLSHARPGDAALVVRPNVVRAFNHYRNRSANPSRAPSIVFPARSDEPFSAGWPESWMPSPTLLAGLPARHERVWLILATKDLTRVRQLQRTLSRHYSSVVDRRFFGIDLQLYSRPARESA